MVHQILLQEKCYIESGSDDLKDVTAGLNAMMRKGSDATRVLDTGSGKSIPDGATCIDPRFSGYYGRNNYRDSYQDCIEPDQEYYQTYDQYYDQNHCDDQYYYQNHCDNQYYDQNPCEEHEYVGNDFDYDHFDKCIDDHHDHGNYGNAEEQDYQGYDPSYDYDGSETGRPNYEDYQDFCPKNY